MEAADCWADFEWPVAKPIVIPEAPHFLRALQQLPQVHKVYRLQNAQGHGPYQDGATSLWQQEPHTPASGRPTPNSDEGFYPVLRKYLPIFFGTKDDVLNDMNLRGWFDLLRRSLAQDDELVNYEIKFGFASIDQLKRWFHNPQELTILLNNGWEMVEIEVIGYDSGKQVIYLDERP